jgi:O-acetyl-ADP-ribose deacetylase (regulator of RNase III)
MINYIIGDATEPIKRPAIITHCCNDIGKWGHGFVVPLGNKYPAAKSAYLALQQRNLGSVNFVTGFDNGNIIIANIIGQHGIATFKDTHPIRYDAIKEGIDTIVNYAYPRLLSIHMPRIGCGLAGGKWSEIEKILNQFPEAEFYVYDLPK